VYSPCNEAEAEDEHGNAFFHNTSTGASQARHPMDDYFSALVVEERVKLPRRRAALVSKSAGRRGQGRDLHARTLWMQFEHPPSEVSEPAAAKEGDGDGDGDGDWDRDGDGRRRRRRQVYYHNFVRDYSTRFAPWDAAAAAAATTIQRARRRAVAERARRWTAAVRLQAAYRGHVVRDAVMTWKRECAALCMQALWRMRLVQRQLAREKAAQHVQAAWRGSYARGEFHKVRQRTRAATRIQAAWRGGVGRETATHTRLQAAARGAAAQKQFAALQQFRAATLIQSAARGMMVRTAARTARAARTIQRAARPFVARTRRVRRTAAGVIVRWWLARRHRLIEAKFRRIMAGELKAAATTVQAAWRGYQGRKLAGPARYERAAAAAAPVLQRAWRGKLGRDAATHRRQTLALVVAQVTAAWMAHVRRREDTVAGMMAAWKAALATRIQARWRGVRGRAHAAYLVRLEAAAMTAQRFARGRIGARRAARLRRNKASRGAALVRISAAVCGMRTRWVLLPALRALAARRGNALYALRLMYADTLAVHVVVTSDTSDDGGEGGAEAQERQPPAPAAIRDALDRMAMREALEDHGGGEAAKGEEVHRGVHIHHGQTVRVGEGAGGSAWAGETVEGPEQEPGTTPLFALTEVVVAAVEALVSR
jgi:hypothetical protein